MRESRSPPSLQGEALADNSGGASLSFKEGERGVIDVNYVPVVLFVPLVHNVHNVHYVHYVHNVIIVPDVPDVPDVLDVLIVPQIH